MSRHHSAQHYKPHRHRRPKTIESTFETAKRYGFIAVASGLGIAFGSNAWDHAQKREAILEALPPGTHILVAMKPVPRVSRRSIAPSQAFPIA